MTRPGFDRASIETGDLAHSTATSAVSPVELVTECAGEPGRHILCLDVSESRTKNLICELKRRGYLIEEFDTRNPRRFLPQLAPLVRSLRRADFLLCGSPLRSLIPWLLLAKIFRVPSIIDCPMDYTAWPFPTVWHCRLAARWVLNLADYVLTLNSRAYLIDKFRLKRERVLFVENCPDRTFIESSIEKTPPRFHPRPGVFQICCSGCHEPHRLERFMPTFEALLASAPQTELLLIGAPEQPTVSAMLRYAQERGFAERVRAQPIIRPPESFFATIARCDLWIATLGDDTLQGRHELRMELLEMGLLERPVVAASTPGILAHDLMDGRDLIMIDPADPDGNARKLADYIHHPERLAEIGSNLRECVIRRFSLSEAIDRVLSAVAGRQSGREPVSTGIQ
jgi:glycosyltransferase involved in cell wall biosynthesis